MYWYIFSSGETFSTAEQAVKDFEDFTETKATTVYWYDTETSSGGGCPVRDGEVQYQHQYTDKPITGDE